jgi:hypothetical protein
VLIVVVFFSLQGPKKQDTQTKSAARKQITKPEKASNLAQ